MYVLDKPEIYIGYRDGNLLPKAEEAAFGIEEEGCLCHRYLMKDDDDIRCSVVGVAVIISFAQSWIFLNDVKDNQLLYRVVDTESMDPYRRLGKNAARYLKGKRLDLQSEEVI